MRWLWWTNSPHVYTGYAGQAKEAMLRMVEMGQRVGCVCNYGIQGASLNWNGIPLYPTMDASNNADVIDTYCEHFDADVLLSLYDIWSLPLGLRQRLPCPWAAMVPVDGTPITDEMKARINETSYLAVYSEFGKEQMDELMEDQVLGHTKHSKYWYVPHAVDTDMFKPLGERESKKWVREELGLPQDKFVVTIVAANKGDPPRKAWPEALAGFKMFHEKHPDTFLYCHTTKKPHGSGYEGIWFDRLMKEVGIEKESIGFPHPGALAVGVPTETMVQLYQGSDCLLLPSMGEGFGLPVIEAQAVGIPVITQACSAMPENTVNGVSIEPFQKFWNSKLGYYWQMPSIERIVEALEDVYGWSDGKREGMKEKGLRFIEEEHAWDTVWDRYWMPFIEHVEDTVW